MGDAQTRLTEVWHPYHDRLTSLLEESRRLFGHAILFDCHSMPHEAIESLSRRGKSRPEIVLGDRFGASAAPGIVDRVEAAFVSAGFVVARNAPFAGGAYMAQHYGRPPARGQHVVQIEIDRALYMNEGGFIRPNGNFGNLRQQLTTIMAELAELGRPPDLPLAAE